MPGPWQASPRRSLGTPTALVAHELPGSGPCPCTPSTQQTQSHPICVLYPQTWLVRSRHIRTRLWGTARRLLSRPHHHTPSEMETNGVYRAPAGHFTSDISSMPHNSLGAGGVLPADG